MRWQSGGAVLAAALSGASLAVPVLWSLEGAGGVQGQGGCIRAWSRIQSGAGEHGILE